MKKLLLFIALTIFGLGLNAQNVGDETTIDYDGYSLKFEITSVSPAECRVSGYTGEPVDVTIPSTVEISGNDFSITSIRIEAFRSCSSLTSIEIPNSVTSIGGLAFPFCSSLTSIVVAEGNTVYDSRENCNAIIETSSNTLIAGCQNTVIPNSVTSIGAWAFYLCSSLTSIEIPNSVTSIGSYAFYGCSSLTSIEIPNSVTSIGHHAFSHCSSLTSIVVAEGNTVYDSRENCNAIIETSSNTLIAGCQNTVIPNSVTSIGNYAFSVCESLTSIEIPNSVISIGEEAFYHCSSLTSIEIPNSVTSIRYHAFYNCSSLTSIEIPNSVISIGEEAFYFCESLTSIEIPNSVTSIGERAFSVCSSLTSIVVAEGNTVYDSRDNCNAIIETSSNTLIAGCQNTVIPNTVTSIGDEAFYGCRSLTSIEIPNSVTSIGNEAFRGCSSLRVIKCHAENVPETGDDVFYGCPYGIIICVPENSVEDYKAEHPWNNYYITAMSEISVIEYDGYSLIYIITDEENTECMVSCAQEPTMPTSITIPSSVEIKGIEYSVTSIGGGAFDGCDNLTSIEIPNSVTSIGTRAFYGCGNLTSIEIPNSVTSIGAEAFSGCSSLTSITFGENSQLTSIGAEAFRACRSLKSIEIPNSVTSIGDLAFYYCSSLTSIEIPNSVTSIGNRAFRYCSSLTGDLIIPNSVTYIGQSAFWGCVGFDGILTLPENLDTIHDYTFGSSNGTMALTGNVVIPETVKYIGDAAFQKCSSLENVTFGENSQLTYIGQWAFTNCNSLASIEIPSGVTYIGQYGLNCSSLKVIKCYAEDVPSTNSKAFYNCPSDMIIYVPENSVEDYKATSPWNEFAIASLDYIGFGSAEVSLNVNTTPNGVAVTATPNEHTVEFHFSLVTKAAFEEKGLENLTQEIRNDGHPAYEQTSVTWTDMVPGCKYIVLGTAKNANDEWGETTICRFIIPKENSEYLFYEDFEDYLEGELLAENNGLYWTTWNKKPGTAEDAEIVELDGNKCAHIKQGVDQVILLGGYTSGKYEIEFDLYVPAGNCAYYNILHDFAGGNSDWALQQYVHMTDDGGNNSTYAPGHGTTHAAGNSVADITQFVFDTWMTISYVIDIDRDVAEFYFSTEKDTAKVKLLEWQWSCNSFNDQSTPNRKLDALNFFIPNNTSEFYLDNFTLKKVEAPTTPAVPDTLFAEALSDTTVVLTWSAVDSVLGYNVYSVIDSTYTLLADSISDTTYTVKGLLPDSTYCFAVAAFNQVGESERKSVTVKTLKADDGSDDGNDNPTDTIVPEPEVLAVPENLVAKAESSSSISLSWDEVENAESYNVYRDGDSIANVTNPTYTDKDLEYNTEYCYTVTAVGDDDVESEESEEVCVKTLGESIEELSSSINIYPNPVENELFIATEVRVNEVSIYDIYGRQTMRQQVNKTTSQQVVDVTDLEAGVYFVKVVTNEGEIVKRFVKK